MAGERQQEGAEMTMQADKENKQTIKADAGDIVPVRVDRTVWKCPACGLECNTEQACLEHVESWHRGWLSEVQWLYVHRTARRSRFDGPMQVHLLAAMDRPRGIEVKVDWDDEEEDELCCAKASYLVPASKSKLEAVRARARRALVEAVEARARKLETLCADVRRRFNLDKETER